MNFKIADYYVNKTYNKKQNVSFEGFTFNYKKYKMGIDIRVINALSDKPIERKVLMKTTRALKNNIKKMEETFKDNEYIDVTLLFLKKRGKLAATVLPNENVSKKISTKALSDGGKGLIETPIISDGNDFIKLVSDAADKLTIKCKSLLKASENEWKIS